MGEVGSSRGAVFALEAANKRMLHSESGKLVSMCSPLLQISGVVRTRTRWVRGCATMKESLMGSQRRQSDRLF